MTRTLKSGFRCGVAVLLFFSFWGTADAADSELHMLDSAHPIHIAAKSLIVAEGDSLTYGEDSTPSGVSSPINGLKISRSPSPYPETLAVDLGNKVTVVNRGFPGDRTIDGLKRWAHAPSGDLALILYGTNDCENYGHIRNGVLSLGAFHAALTELVKRRQADGAQVVLLTPPPVRDSNQEEELKPYRMVVAVTAKETGAALFDTVSVLRRMSDPWIDIVHLKPEAYAAIARALAESIKVEKKPR